MAGAVNLIDSPVWMTAWAPPVHIPIGGAASGGNMTLLIFRMERREFATTGWTARAYSTDSIRIDIVGDLTPVYFQMSMAEFLAKKVGDTIDLRV